MAEVCGVGGSGMSDATATAGAVAANSLQAVVAGCASLRVSEARVATHVGKPVEVQAISGLELTTGSRKTWPAWIVELADAGRLVVTDHRFIVLGDALHSSDYHEEGLPAEWLVRWPDGSIQIFGDAAFETRFRPIYGEPTA